MLVNAENVSYLTMTRPRIFWKLPKVSFREIITMKAAQPIIKEGALERLLRPDGATSPDSRQDRTPTQGALVRSGRTDNDENIRHISHTVSNLHDSMTELKSSFTALRIELNGSGLEDGNNYDNFGMVSTVLKELKAKSDEIVNLRLEIEALKVKNKYAMMSQSASEGGGSFPTAKNPGLLLEGSGRKRTLGDAYPGGRTQPVSDSFEEDDDDETDEGERILAGSIPLLDAAQQSTKVPLRRSGPMSPSEEREGRAANGQMMPPSQANDTSEQPNVVVKRPRLSQPVADGPPMRKQPVRRASTQNRRSFSATPNPEPVQPPRPAPLGEANGDVNSAGRGRKKGDSIPAKRSSTEVSGTESNQRNLRSRSRAPSPSGARPQVDDNDARPLERNKRAQTVGITDSNSLAMRKNGSLNGLENEGVVHDLSERLQESIQAQEQLHRAEVSSRDSLAKMTMKREEAMESEQERASSWLL